MNEKHPYDMSTICKHCGYRYGAHHMTSRQCPSTDEIDDQTFYWLMNRFEPVAAESKESKPMTDNIHRYHIALAIYEEYKRCNPACSIMSWCYDQIALEEAEEKQAPTVEAPKQPTMKDIEGMQTVIREHSEALSIHHKSIAKLMDWARL